MARWAAFAGVTLAVLSLLLLLARASQSVVTGGSDPTADEGATERGSDAPRDASPDNAGGTLDDAGDDTLDAAGNTLDVAEHDTRGDSAVGSTRERPRTDHPWTDRPRDGGPADGGPEPLPQRLLLVNVALSQGLFAAVLLGGAWFAEVPPSALGVAPTSWSTGLPALAVGVGFGVALAAVNTVGGALARRAGLDPSEELRELLAPDSVGGWALLLGVVLPVVAGFEELLFRGALVGAFSVGFGVSPWLLAVASSVAFALGHGAQGPLGVAVTGALGFVLAAGFVLTGSLLVVVVAHYLVNAFELVVHEGTSVEFG